jgi:hypothetical protein
MEASAVKALLISGNGEFLEVPPCPDENVGLLAPCHFLDFSSATKMLL